MYLMYKFVDGLYFYVWIGLGVVGQRGFIHFQNNFLHATREYDKMNPSPENMNQPLFLFRITYP